MTVVAGASQFEEQLVRLRQQLNNFDVSSFATTSKQLDAVLLQEAALARGLRVSRHGNTYVLVASHRRRGGFKANVAPGTPLFARKATNRKDIAKRLLQQRGLPVARGGVFSTYEQARAYFRSLEAPVVVKPVIGAHGQGVWVNIRNEADFAMAFKHASGFWPKVLVEEFVVSTDVRIVVVGGRAVAAVYRDPANVIGDGRCTIEQLIQEKNRVRQSNPHASTRPVVVTREMRNRLKTSSRALASIPSEGERIVLHEKANVSAGGDSIGVTEIIHPSFFRLAERSLDAFRGLGHGGVDILATDFAKPADVQRHIVCEVNYSNVISIHHFPLYGPPQNVAQAMIDHYFPEAAERAEPLPRIPSGFGQALGDEAFRLSLVARFTVQKSILRLIERL
jgi:D-alanine-D-alanine ligase-like ATP-grasp enzyme